MIYRINGNVIPETPDECDKEQCDRCEFKNAKYTSHMSRPGFEISTCAYRNVLVTLCLRESAIVDFEIKTFVSSPNDKFNLIKSLLDNDKVGDICSLSEKEQFIETDESGWVCFCDECDRPAQYNSVLGEWFCAYFDCSNESSVKEPDNCSFTAQELSKVEFERLLEKYSHTEWL